jgi:hypothetical protein
MTIITERALLEQALDALNTCKKGVYCDIDGDFRVTYHYDTCKVKAAIEAATAALAAQPSAPAWHDAPNAPGVWMSSSSNSVRQLDEYDIHNLGKYNSSRRWFGHISPDTEDTK